MARDIVIDSVTYLGVSQVSLNRQDGGLARFIFLDGDPEAIPRGKADVTVNGVNYNTVGVVRLRDRTGNPVLFVLPAGGRIADYPVYPGHTIQAGGLVTVVAGLLPGPSLYPSATRYPSRQEMVRAFSEGQPDGIAMESGGEGETVQVYILE